MELGTAKVRNRSARPDVGQRPILPVPVVIDGDLQLRPDAAPNLAREVAALVERRRAERNDRHHVRGPDARMDAAVVAKVDALDRFPDGAGQTLEQAAPGARQRDDGTVVIRIDIGVKEVSVTGGGRDRLDDFMTAALRKVRHRFEKCCSIHANR